MKFRGYDDYADDPDVYPPCDDSILLIQSLEVSPGMRVLEIGCGSGVVSIHAALEGARVTAVDINPKAVELTRTNAKRMGAELDGVTVSDLFGNVEGRFDRVLFNLPYLPVEEGEVDGMISKAWAGGPDGLGPFPRLVAECPDHLEEDGKLVVVVSSLMDGEALESVLSGLRVRCIGTESYFFEKLEVLEISFSRAVS